jgi:EmrB/QacA subfamily drug resistance transporter
MPTLILLCAAQFMVILDITVVNVALPSIGSDLGIGTSDLQWVITAYTLAFGGLLLVGGRATDLFGARRLFLGGLLVFTAASLTAALAEGEAQLLLARIGQGIGAAFLSPAALSLVSTIFPEGRERRRALTAWAAVAASGGAFGVLAGGILSETLDWRAIFLINLPIGVAAFAAATRLLPATKPRTRGRIDLAGAALALLTLPTAIYAVVEAPQAGWGSTQTIGLLAFAGAGIILLLAVESRVRQPMLSIAALRRPQTATALVLMMAGMGTVVSTFFFLTIYLQDMQGYSALETGVAFFPGGVMLVVAAQLGGHLMPRIGPRGVLAGGMALAAVGALLLAGLPASGSYAADVLPGLLVLDAGIGIAASGIFVTGMAGVGHDEAGAVSGLLSTGHELGVAVVLAVLSTVAIGSIGPDLVDAGTAGHAAILGGFGDAFRVAAALTLAAGALSLITLRRVIIADGAGHGHGHAMAH